MTISRKEGKRDIADLKEEIKSFDKKLEGKCLALENRLNNVDSATSEKN